MIGQPQQYYPGQTFTGQTPTEQQGQQQQLAYAQNTLPGLTSQVQNSWQNLLNSPDVANNQYVQDMMASNADQVNQNLAMNIMPQIQSNSLMHGSLGSSRQGIAQGVAAGLASQGLANANAQTQMQAYQTGMDAQKYGLGFAPQLTQLGLQPGQIMQGIGQQQRAENDLQRQEDIQRYYYNQGAPMQNLQSLSAIFSGSPWGSSGTKTGPGAPTNTFQNVLGAGTLGLGAYNAGLFSSTAFPWLASGAGGVAATSAADLFSPLMYGALMM
jgi:hypothetical protein